ncbi:hypothetical protein C7B62_07265 [Pleurocapsa sp. CCALA 161]|uniref:hypothetical protein n=1 Tax=Pleurocapsa sp. CCALA 161 TaxID=2107688 RepID=UPI000D07A541|nr:hypothetical protein [Pleurocapsa sp. CCALA 161]PSB11038.1 hypothetical protein C7B62_07265 [Pleurocapsa sp. CCALA 161]
MRTRARRRMPHAGQNLDSFLDVLTNTVGVLIFVSIFASLIATGGDGPKSRVTIQTPLSSPTNKEALWFEIRNKKVSNLDLRQVRAKELDLSGSLPNCNKPTSGDSLSLGNYQSCLLSILGRQSNFRVDTANYRVRTVDQGVSLLFEPLSANIGETTTQLGAANSTYQQVLSKFNPQKDYLVFIVRPDSFEAFRNARKKAWEAGYEVGWEPIDQDAPIKIRTIIGSELPGGKSIGVQ